MNNFIYVSEKYRNAVCDYVSESEDFSEEQKLAFEVLIFDEQRLLKWVGRPPSMCRSCDQLLGTGLVSLRLVLAC